MKSESLIDLFNRNNSDDILKEDDEKQLIRIREKLIKLYELKNKKIENNNTTYAYINDPLNNEESNDYKNYRNRNNTIRNMMAQEFYKNIVIFSISASTFIYFTKFSNFFTKVNSLIIFKPLFLFTFCASPFLISLYFSKLSCEYEHKKHIQCEKHKI
jgi:hypothetical protein